MSEHEATADSLLSNDSHGYKDVDTYVKMPDGSEWLFQTSLCYETGETAWPQVVRYARDCDADFEDRNLSDAPELAVAAYQRAKPDIEKLLAPPPVQTLEETVAALEGDRALDGVVRDLITTVDSQNGIGLTASNAIPLTADFVFQVGAHKLQLKEDGLYFDGRKTETTEEQDAAFRSFLDSMMGLFPKSRIPLMINTQSAGLRPASEFDAIEIHEMVYDDLLGYLPMSEAGDDAEYDPDAISVFVHCKKGGTECLADFPFDPSEPGTEAAARAAADAFAASVGSVIANAHAHLPHTYIMRQEHLNLIEGVLKYGC